MRISNLWFRTRKDKGYHRSLISYDCKKKWSTYCKCDDCSVYFVRNESAKKYGFDKCDKCWGLLHKETCFTDDVRKKISLKVSAAYANPTTKANKSLATIKAYQNPENKMKQKMGSQKRSANEEYRQKLRDNAARGPEHAIKTSCGKQGIKVEEFSGFITGIDIRERELCKTTVGKECLIKANFCCDICNKNSNLHAHHMNSWHWAVNERFDIKNLVALCHKCHSEFHSLYGSKFNTKEQYFEFKSMR